MTILASVTLGLASVTWTDSTQAIAAVVTAIVTAIGFTLVYWQVVQTKRTLNSATHAAIYSQEQEINELFVANPECREYFYHGRECPPGQSDRLALLSITDMVADFFEHIVQQRNHLPKGIWPAWVAYMRSVYECSPLLREQLARNRTWYDSELLRLLGIGDAPGDELGT